jgi:hypothetical protein
MDSNETAKGFETLGEAARRLLAKMDERKRPPAEKAGEIQADNIVKFPDRRGGRSADNLVPQFRAPAFTQARRW